MKVLIIGSTFEAPSWAHWISQSPDISAVHLWVVGVYPVPNKTEGKIKFVNMSIKPNTDTILAKHKELQTDVVWCMDTRCCAAGVVDDLQAAGVNVIGATKAWGQLEFNKLAFKKVCVQLNIPTPPVKAIIENPSDTNWHAITYPVVIKPEFSDGIKTNVYHHVQDVLVGVNPSHLKQDTRLFLEDYQPHSEELEIVILVADDNIISLGTGTDYKNYIGDASKKNATHGHIASATCPSDSVDKEQVQQILEIFVRPLINFAGLTRGVFGIQLIKGLDGQFYFIEINARPGGPDLTSLWLKTDAYQFLSKLTKGTLTQADIHLLDDDGKYYGLYSIFPKTQKALLNTNIIECADYQINDDTLIKDDEGNYRAIRTINPIVIGFTGDSAVEVEEKAKRLIPTIFDSSVFDYFLD